MEQIDAKSVQFLNAVRYYGGKANITEIRKMTGMNRNEANYRFRKLLDMELIDVTSEKSPGDLPDRKVAHLTGTARRELEKGLGSATTAGLVISDEPEATEVSREVPRNRGETGHTHYESKGDRLRPAWHRRRREAGKRPRRIYLRVDGSR